ncbi:DNA polymerase III subunit gamma and tau [Brevibacterium sp. ZH18]|uniref:DNA polymerase III subunit gamma and tau n=1 Tax=Brevibacterium sp. ZH18 TaxID=2927784 RepID=UPI001F608BA3|nr:DNA polymerase III subunit gamma and tau [Brevibacterium sp. ZH18]
MSTALYRRYRPETFDEVIGQEHVTDPLKAAIERGRINHAYLFSGPRGCGKTTSARILARCLNCEKGPTPVPCGECPSCQDLANGGPGSLDVVEIDAASHNGVDDARDLRERAIYAPARDRYKVFILDEAHMVTSQGFNALLKIVEEPPPHIKFIFATTEPEKVIGTIRSRTHHYPFRLVPPEALGNYLEELCGREDVQVAKGVLPLVVRAGGGSVRDTLSVLDQLIAGSGPDGVDYQRAIALLGYTPDSLLSDIVDAFSAGDGGGVYRAVERVIESGQDPRRFVEDLLERMRDLIVINAAPESAHAFLPEVPPDRLERLTLQASGFGQGELSRAADLLNHGLTEMSGATSPRLQLELICARILLPGSGRSRDAVLSRVERMERRIGMSASGTGANIPPAPQGSAQTSQPAEAPQPSQSSPQSAQSGQQAQPGQSAAAGAQPSGPTQSSASARSLRGAAGGAVHDDFDELADLALAAESMLNEPAPSEPAPRESAPSQTAQPESAQPESAQSESAQREPARQEPAQRESARQESAAVGSAPVAGSDASVAAPNINRDDSFQANSSTESGGAADNLGAGRASAGGTAADDGSASAGGAASDHGAASDYAPAGESATSDAGAGAGAIGGEIEAIRRAWPSILAAVEKRSRLTRAIIAANAIPQSFSDGVVYLGFNNAGSVHGFQQRDHAAKLAMAINDVLGIQARIDIGDVGRIAGGSAQSGSGQGGSGQDTSGQGGFGRDSGGKGASAPVLNGSTGNHGPAVNQRRPSPQEVAAVVGTREVDKPQVDHEKFWETNDSPRGPWSSDDEEGDPSAESNDPSPVTQSQKNEDHSSTANSDSQVGAAESIEQSTNAASDAASDTNAGSASDVDTGIEAEATEPVVESSESELPSSGSTPADVETIDSAATDSGPADSASADPASEAESGEAEKIARSSDGRDGNDRQTSSNDSGNLHAAADDSAVRADSPTGETRPTADSDIVVPDLSDDDFFGDPTEQDTSADPGNQPEVEPAADAPMEYAQPRWEEPTWHDGPQAGASAGSVSSSTDAVGDSTSAGSGAVEVGALVVPPPEDDDLDFLGAYADPDVDFAAGGEDSAQSPAPAPVQTSGFQREQGSGSAKPFKSRFAAIAQRHGVEASESSPAQPPGSGYPANGNGAYAEPGGFGGNGPANDNGQPQNFGADEDEYDPETDLDVSDAPQIGVAVIARVLGGEIIDERDV